MKLKSIKDKLPVMEVKGQADCFNDCKHTYWDGNRNAKDNNGRCRKKTSSNCQFTCDW